MISALYFHYTVSSHLKENDSGFMFRGVLGTNVGVIEDMVRRCVTYKNRAFLNQAFLEFSCFF